MLCSCDLFVFSSLRTANKFQSSGFLWWTAGDSHNWSQAVPTQEGAVVIPLALPIIAPSSCFPTQQEAALASTECCSQLKNSTLGLLHSAGSNWNGGEVSQGYFPAENRVSPGEGQRTSDFYHFGHLSLTLLWSWADTRHTAKAELTVMITACRR